MYTVLIVRNFYIKKAVSNKWFVLLLNTVFFSLMAWLLPIHFEENDDVVMCMIANGLFSGNPDGHLVFLNAIFGWMIAGLYMMTNVVEWYALIFCVLHVLAMTGIVYMVIRDKGLPIVLKLAFLLFMYVLWARIIIGFQFTTTAGLLCFCGCLALLQHSRKWFIAGMGVIFVASLIRFSAAGLVGVLCSPLLVFELMRDNRYVYRILVVAVLALLGHCMDGLFYQQTDWAYYKAYNTVRGKIHDNPNAFLLSESDLPKGVTMEDYQLFCGFEGDSKILDLQRLQLIESRIQESISYEHAIKNLSQISLYRTPLALLCFGWALCLVLNVKRKNKSRAAAVITAVVLFITILVYLGMFASLKNRVFLCMVVPLVYQMLKLLPELDLQKGNETIMVMTGIMTALIAKYVYQDYKVVRYTRIRQEEFDAFQNPLIQDNKGILYLSCVMNDCMHPFAVKDYKFKNVGLGWLMNIPLQKGVLESHVDFVDSEILCFCRAGQPPFQLVKAIKRNYGVDAEPVQVDSNEKYALYALRSYVEK